MSELLCDRTNIK